MQDLQEKDLSQTFRLWEVEKKAEQIIAFSEHLAQKRNELMLITFVYWRRQGMVAMTHEDTWDDPRHICFLGKLNGQKLQVEKGSTKKDHRLIVPFVHFVKWRGVYPRFPIFEREIHELKLPLYEEDARPAAESFLEATAVVPTIGRHRDQACLIHIGNMNADTREGFPDYMVICDVFGNLDDAVAMVNSTSPIEAAIAADI